MLPYILTRRLFVMRKSKPIKIVVHPPKPENAEKFAAILSAERVRLLEALLTTPRTPAPN
jgi:hypothetical protein